MLNQYVVGRWFPAFDGRAAVPWCATKNFYPPVHEMIITTEMKEG